MTKRFSAPFSLKKAPSTVAVSGAVVAIFVGALFYGSAMAGAEIWSTDPQSAYATVWNNLGGLYFGVILPILVAGIVGTLMQPEFQRANIQWIGSQPGGTSFVFREKLRLLLIVCGFIAIMQAFIVIAYGVFTGRTTEYGFMSAVGAALLSGVGMLAVGAFYLWISTYTRSIASTVSIAIALTVASMAAAVATHFAFNSTIVEMLLPTTQVISTSFTRNLGAENMGLAMLTVLPSALCWSGMFLTLFKRRLARG
ncbi:ABC transporter permease [Corynebacterium camporealensis]|uniref:ABC-2 family transporter protein n=1 Tax=Corynebacterium camporealensis TaxID=161896 RepID=A0A0F6TCL0_9CORY|nr:ABC transporter permease [Corynebacterium camporealensis]AKE40149.1 ABC-2 family transporter protein [Corynebacterium camporealensis]